MYFSVTVVLINRVGEDISEMERLNKAIRAKLHGLQEQAMCCSTCKKCQSICHNHQIDP